MTRRAPLLAAALVSAALLASLPARPAAGQTGLDGPRADYFAGRYDEALQALRPLVRSPGNPEARILQARVLRETGRYEDALEILPAGEPRLARTRGEILLEVGRWDEAEAAFLESVEGGAPDALVARLRLGEQAFRRGRREEAMEVFDSFIDVYNGSDSLSGEELLAVARAVTWLGRATPALFQDALRAYDEAADRLPGDPRPAVAVGDLFLSRYASPDAYDEYRRVLERNPGHPGALLGRARAQDFDGSPEALATARQALETNPRLVGAHLLAARIHMRAEDHEAAREAVDEALEVDPRSLEALSLRASVQYLSGDMGAYRATVAELERLNPTYPGLYTTLAGLSADQRQYGRAVEFAREAVERDPQAWDARGILATNQLRTGAMEAGRRNMEAAFAGDPYNPWFKNTLDLLDTFQHFRIVETEHFRIALHGREADLLEPYVAELAERGYAAMRARYGAEPPTPIRLELFPSSADFSVRTLGMVGMGALGVSFGSTLVMDSPSARGVGEFNWASVLWHELAHAFHLGLSDHEVPRWFSEGLAVREQRVADPRWGFRASPAFLQLWSQGGMPPLSRTNEALVRPDFPQQVGFAYLQASLAFDWMEETFGFGSIRDFLAGYRDGRTTEELVPSVLGMDVEAMDQAFEDYMRERFADELRATAGVPSPLTGGGSGAGAMDGIHAAGGGAADMETLRNRVRAQPGSFPARLALGRALAEAERWDEAEEHLREALRLFPAYGDADGPLRHLARMHEARGELPRAADALRRLGMLNENAHAVYLEEARLRREMEDAAGERDALVRAVEVFPYETASHARLAELAEEAGETELAVRERRAVLALDPVDRADAHFRLARALLAHGDGDGARTQLLRALEIAPSFEAALELLLELRGGGS